MTGFYFHKVVFTLLDTQDIVHRQLLLKFRISELQALFQVSFGVIFLLYPSFSVQNLCSFIFGLWWCIAVYVQLRFPLALLEQKEMFACFDLIGVNYEIQSLTGKILCLIKILLWLNITQGKNHTQPSINDFKFTKKLP